MNAIVDFSIFVLAVLCILVIARAAASLVQSALPSQFTSDMSSGRQAGDQVPFGSRRL